MARKRKFSDLAKKEYRLKDGSVMVIRREPNSRCYGVEQFDRTDISRWHKTFVSFEAALEEYERWKDDKAEHQDTVVEG